MTYNFFSGIFTWIVLLVEFASFSWRQSIIWITFVQVHSVLLIATGEFSDVDENLLILKYVSPFSAASCFCILLLNSVQFTELIEPGSSPSMLSTSFIFSIYIYILECIFWRLFNWHFTSIIHRKFLVIAYNNNTSIYEDFYAD